MNVAEAYRQCEDLTRSQARNFYYGIRLLAPDKRRAMSALYALARRIDDIGDGDGPAPAKLEALEAVRRDVAELAGAGPAADFVLQAVADVARRYPLPLGALDELIEGCEMDVRGTTYATFDDLVGYCRRVAGSVGRLSLAVYGTSNPVVAEPLADSLGVAMQIINILRDVVEDRDELGRVYLPLEDLLRFDVSPDLSGPHDNLVALISFETVRAAEWYERGIALLPMLDRRSRACTAAMAGIYHRLLERIAADPALPLRGRLSLGAAEKASVAFRSLTRGAA